VNCSETGPIQGGVQKLYSLFSYNRCTDIWMIRAIWLKCNVWCKTGKTCIDILQSQRKQTLSIFIVHASQLTQPAFAYVVWFRVDLIDSSKQHVDILFVSQVNI